MFDLSFYRRKPPAAVQPDALDVMRGLEDTNLPAGYDRTRRRADFRSVFDENPRNRRVLRQILDRCRVCDRSHVPGDTHETARREGARDIGLWLLEILTEDVVARPARAETEQPDTDDRI